jgi:hypothetical protein
MSLEARLVQMWSRPRRLPGRSGSETCPRRIYGTGLELRPVKRVLRKLFVALCHRYCGVFDSMRSLYLAKPSINGDLFKHRWKLTPINTAENSPLHIVIP